jgi:hypothetical protein
MTDAEDAANAKANEVIRACRHCPFLDPDGVVRCHDCGAKFETILLMRKAVEGLREKAMIPPFPWDD